MPWTANRAAWLLMKPEAELDTKEKATLQQIFLADEQVVEAHKFAHAFQEIIELLASTPNRSVLNHIFNKQQIMPTNITQN